MAVHDPELRAHVAQLLDECRRAREAAVRRAEEVRAERGLLRAEVAAQVAAARRLNLPATPGRK